MPPPPAACPGSGSIRYISVVSENFPARTVDKKTSWPRRAPRGALRRGAIVQLRPYGEQPPFRHHDLNQGKNPPGSGDRVTEDYTCDKKNSQKPYIVTGHYITTRIRDVLCRYCLKPVMKTKCLNRTGTFLSARENRCSLRSGDRYQIRCLASFPLTKKPQMLCWKWMDAIEPGSDSIRNQSFS